MAEGLLHHRSPQTEQIPGQQPALLRQMKDRLDVSVRAGKKDRILRQPLQRGLRGEIKILPQLRLRGRDCGKTSLRQAG